MLRERIRRNPEVFQEGGVKGVRPENFLQTAWRRFQMRRIDLLALSIGDQNDGAAISESGVNVSWQTTARVGNRQLKVSVVRENPSGQYGRTNIITVEHGGMPQGLSFITAAEEGFDAYQWEPQAKRAFDSRQTDNSMALSTIVHDLQLVDRLAARQS